jgi:glycosyltransferase involved in cell wall biosynthesis
VSVEIPPPGRLNVTIVAANPFEFDSRFLRSATSLAADGHAVRILGWSAPGLPPEEELAPGVWLTRLDIDRRISLALKPLPQPMRRGLCRLLGLDVDAQVLPPDAPRGLDRLRHPLRRVLEVVANARRAGPWAETVVATAPETDVFHAQSLVVLPVVRRAARELGGRFVYDVADYHTEAARLARMPWLVRELVRRRERDWARDASGYLAVSEPVADLVVRRWGVPRPTVLWNCPPAWRADEPGIIESDRIRAATGIETGRPIVLYQGGFSVDRGVEELIAAAREPKLMELGAAVVFMGYGRLETFIAEAAAAHPGRIYLLPAVRPDDLMPWTASADVSFVGQPPRTLNQRMNLPNKLFESIMAGVPVVVSEGNEQCRLTKAEGIGLCVDVDDPAAIAAACAELLTAPAPERRVLRAHCREVALERYTWEHTAVGLVELYDKLARERAPVGPGRSIRDGGSPREEVREEAVA